MTVVSTIPGVAPTFRGPARRARILPSVLQESLLVTPLAGSPGTPPPVHFSTDPNAIVSVVVSTVEAPTPNTYQQCGALVSFGGTTLTPQSVQLLTQFSDLNNPVNGVLIGPAAVTTAVWAAGVVTVTVPALPAGWIVGSTPSVVLAGFTPVGYNGAYTAQVTSATTFTVPLVTSPGVVTTEGTFQPGDAVELSQMTTTFFSQGNLAVVWVLECGAGTSLANDISNLETWIQTNPLSFYGYLLPRKFGATSAGITAATPLLAQFQSPTSMTYFWLTVNPTTMTLLGPTYKDVIQFVEAPANVDPTLTNLTNVQGEFSLAAMFYNAMAYVPSPITMVAPMAFKYLFGVRAYPTKNNGPLLKTIKTANTNYVSSGAQGGIANNIVYDGITLDGNDYFNWWWTIDWVQINAALDVANAIINGSNNPLSPLYYDTPGINMLLATLTNTMSRATQFGMVNGTLVATSFSQPDLQLKFQTGSYAGMCVVNAIPFGPYVAANPGHYKIGEYDGLSVTFIPNRGFIHVIISIVATNLPNF